MVKVKKVLAFSDKIGGFYSENVEKELKDISNEFEEGLNKYLEKKCSEEGLTRNNSVYKSIMPFSFKSRVKSKDSLEEKVIRYSIAFEDVNKKNILDSFDDLIGITILTKTIGFQDVALNYFKSYVKENKDIKILNEGKEKKELFGNSRIEYAHLKLKYKNFPIELQIKSVFLSAFADLEHTLFYKDFNIYELKNYNKKFMHLLAPILLDLENILHEIYTQNNSGLKSEKLKSEIYECLRNKKSEILNLETKDEYGKLDFCFNKAAELLSIYYSEKGATFSGEIEIHNSEDKVENIISLLFDKSIEFEVINSIFEDTDDFFEYYLRGELKKDERYRPKINLLKEQISFFIIGINNIVKYENMKKLKMKEQIKLKDNFNDFLSVHEKFTMEFEEQIEEIKPEIQNLINSCLIIQSLVEEPSKINLEELELEFQIFKNAEDSGEIDMELSESIQDFIVKEWGNFE